MKKLTLFLATIALSLSSTNLSFASFTDVSSSHPNYEAINYVQSEGIVEGYPGGIYKPDQIIDRYEFTKIIVGATHSQAEIDACKTSTLKDVPTDWFTPYVCVAQKEGIVSGYPDGTFQGTNQIKLVEAAKIIVNGFKYPVQEDAVTWYKPYILKLEELKALPVTLTGFEHKETRGEMAEEMYRLMAKVTDKPSTTYENLKLVTVSEGASAGEISNKAAIYANTITKISIEASKSHIDYLNTLLSLSNETDFDALDIQYKKALKDLDQGKLALQSLPAFLSDSTLKEAYINLMDTMVNTLNNELKDLVDLSIKINEPDYIPIEADAVKIESLSKQIIEKMNALSEKVESSKKTFSIKFDFNILPQGKVDLEAYNYLNNILIYQSKGTDPLNNYNILVDSTLPPGDYEMLDKKRIEAMNGIKKISEEVSLMEGYKGDISLRDALVDFFKVGLNVLENEHKQLIDLRIKMNNGQFTEEDIDKVSQLYASANEKLANSNEIFNAAQKNFSEKY